MSTTRQGLATSPADRSLIIGQIQALVKDGLPLRKACAELGINHNNYYRWTADAAPIQAPKEKAKRGRKTKFELGKADARRLRFWRLVKGSIPLAVEAFIAEGLTGNEEPYFTALKACLENPGDTGHRCTADLAKALLSHWRAATEARKVVQWPLSVQRACRVTAAEEAQFRGDKAAHNELGKERRSNLIRTETGELIPWYAGAIWESDDMSDNEPFRFHDNASGTEMTGRQVLATVDAYSLHFLGASLIGRDRDSYRAEDIADHFRDLVEAHGLPFIWRIERGRWDNNFIWGCKIGTDANGKDIRWGGLDAIIHIRDKFTSEGKANIEGSFDLLQALKAHGFNGQTLSIGRERGEFEKATKVMLAGGRGNANALSKFWTIGQAAESWEQVMQLFNSRPKKRQAFGNETHIPAELWASHVKRPCPSDALWRFCAVKTQATVRKGIIEVRAPHYPLSFRFRLHGGSRTPNIHCDNGHEVLIAFTPSRAWEGCHVFNADRSARNREGWTFGQRLGVAEYMADALQEDLAGEGYSNGQRKASAQVRRETRIILTGTHFTGRRVSHAQDSFGNQLTQASTARTPEPMPDPIPTPAPAPIMSTPTPTRTDTPAPARASTPALPASDRSRTPAPAPEPETEAPRHRRITRRQIETTAPDFDEEEELLALKQH